ncbi:hypothetical protein J6590_090269 [Homalodisca vitripennis]|nr:hypothetical protein J6590_090269 [Homalodisca vitripennis]
MGRNLCARRLYHYFWILLGKTIYGIGHLLQQTRFQEKKQLRDVLEDTWTEETELSNKRTSPKKKFN